MRKRILSLIVSFAMVMTMFAGAGTLSFAKEEVVFTVCEAVTGQESDYTAVKGYTISELEELAEDYDGYVYGQYTKGDQTTVIYSEEYVPFSALLEDAGLDDADQVYALCSDGVYSKQEFKECLDNSYLALERTETKVTGEVDIQAISDAYDSAEKASGYRSIVTTAEAGKSFASGMTGLIAVYPAVFTVNTMDCSHDELTAVKSYSARDLEKMAAAYTEPVYGQYTKGDQTTVIYSEEYVPFAALLEDAGVNEYNEVYALCSDGLYSKQLFSGCIDNSYLALECTKTTGTVEDAEAAYEDATKETYRSIVTTATAGKSFASGMTGIAVETEGHVYDAPYYNWEETEDGYTCTAEFTCTICENVEKVPCEVTKTVTEPTYTAEGTAAYTAKVTFENQEYEAVWEETTAPMLTLKAPSSVTAVLSAHDDITVKWAKVEGAEKYIVKYHVTGTDTWNQKTVTSASATMKDLKDGTKYTVKVYAVAGTNKSAASELKYVTTLKKMAAPTVKKYSSSKVTVKWAKVTGATGYVISRSTKKTGTYTVATVKSSSKVSTVLKTTKNKKYYYKVRAYKVVNGKRIYAPWSSVKTYTLK